jgi:ribonucleoside-diphosphate reductase alpha chain
VIKYDEHTQKVLEKRYLADGEKTIEDVFRRVANRVSDAESDNKKEWAQTFYQMMVSQQFVPNSPLLWSAGITDMPFACNVLPLGDSREEIFECLRDAVTVESKGGGVGFDFSKLRPKGSIINGTGGLSSGTISFMEIFDKTMGEVIKQGKRGGAMIGVLRYDHPDIEEFIICKQNNGMLSHFNISVALDDKFMAMVEKDKAYQLYHPNGDGSPNQGKVVNARDIWNKLCENAHQFAEPGLLFLDTINKDNIGEEYIVATNPCVAKGTLVNTPTGYMRVEDVRVGTTVSTVLGSEPVTDIETHENYPVYNVTFSNGNSQRVTAAHIYYVRRKGVSTKLFEKIRVDQIQPGDHVRLYAPEVDITHRYGEYSDGLKMGILLGDGCYTDSVLSKGNVKIASSIGDSEYNFLVKELFGIDRFNADDISKNSKSMNMIMKFTENELISLGLTPGQYSHQKTFDIISIGGSKAIGILDGLLATDGNINPKSHHPQLRWDTSSRELAINIYRLLVSIGCYSGISVSNSKGGTIDGREILRKHPKYTVTMSGHSIDTYWKKTRILDIHPGKGQQLKQLMIDFVCSGNVNYTTVRSIEPAGTDTVYDLYCEDSDTWITEGFVQQGCGEIPLPEYGLCCLGSINLTKFVDVETKKFDLQAFGKIVELGVRFLDDTLTIANYPLPKTKEVAERDRRIGLGIMGFADACILLNIKYGSSSCIDFINAIGKVFESSSIKASEALCEERGTTKYIENCCKKAGIAPRRNISIRTIAPTGSISMLAQCSSGIEPVFCFEYTRNDTVGKSKITHPIYEKYGNDKSISSDAWVTAHEVTVDQHLAVQATWQRYIDSSISKTLNAPADIPMDEVKRIFWAAYKTGCKGVTFYRDGSISGQVLQMKETQGDNGIVEKRPRTLPCEIHFHSVKGARWCIALGILNEEPYELFACPADEIKFKAKEVGWIEKKKRGTYILHSNGDSIELTHEIVSQEQAEICRLVSISLRHKIPLQYIVDQLEKSSGDFQAMSRAASRCLKKFIKNGTRVAGFTCPECGNTEAVRIDGCIACPNCKWTRCH